MSPSIRKHRPQRPRLFWLVALLLLWQQIGLAANLCPMPAGQALAAAATPSLQPDCMPGMHAMHTMRGAHGHANAALCDQHCAQGRLVRSDARPPNVPGSMLPPLAPAMPTVAMWPRAASSFASVFRPQADHPPLRLLFCSLLI
jgi:hypothetical protein